MQTVNFDISSALLLDGGKVVEPDKDGIYRDQPLMVIGKVSRNNKWYEVQSMLEAITAPSSIFYRKLRASQLEGEYNHPLIWAEADLPRMMLIDRTRVSHLILRTYTKSTEAGTVIMYGDLKCIGPMGSHLKESYADPYRNPAFSLRSIVSVIGKKDNAIRQKVLALVTIDAVDCPGYTEASKVHVPGLEGLSVAIDPTVVSKQQSSTATESLVEQQLLDILESNKVTIQHNVSLRGMVDVRANSLITESGPASIFHNLFDRN